MEKQFLDMEEAVIPMINAEQGIKSVALRRRLVEMFPQYTYEQTSGVLSRMMDENKFYFRPSEFEGHFAYELFTILPLNARPEEFGKRKAQSSPKNRSNMGVVPPPEPPKPPCAPRHPPHKPATLTVNIEMPDGSLAVFTLDEVVRLYEQVRRVLESFSRVSL